MFPAVISQLWLPCSGYVNVLKLFNEGGFPALKATLMNTGRSLAAVRFISNVKF